MNDTPALAYVVLRCSDLERSRMFYEALGVALRAEQHGAGARHYSMTLGDVVIELYPIQGEPSAGVRVGLRVADPSAAVASVRAAGGEVVRVDADGALVRDPDGHTIHLAAG